MYMKCVIWCIGVNKNIANVAILPHELQCGGKVIARWWYLISYFSHSSIIKKDKNAKKIYACFFNVAIIHERRPF